MVFAEAIDHSPSFRRWRDAIHTATGTDVLLLGAGDLARDLHRVAETSALCRLLGSRSRRCAACRARFAGRLLTLGTHHAGPFAMRCHAGLTVAAIPLTMADGSTAFLVTVPAVLRRGRGAGAAAAVVGRVVRGGDSGLPEALVARLARGLPVRDPRQFHATVTLLHLLAVRLSHLSRQMLEAPGNGWHDGVAVRRSCEVIEQRFTENLRLEGVARDVGVSRSYLSHLFMRTMGLSFTDYLAGRRVVELKRLLGDSALSVTEALFAAGFQSVSQGNRVFRTATGMPPSAYRRRLQPELAPAGHQMRGEKAPDAWHRATQPDRMRW